MPIAYKWWHSFHYQEWHPAKLHPLWFPLKSSKYPSKPWQSWKKRTYPPQKKSSPPPPENKALLKLLNHYFMKGARSRLVKGWAGSWPATAQAKFYLGAGVGRFLTSHFRLEKSPRPGMAASYIMDNKVKLHRHAAASSQASMALA